MELAQWSVRNSPSSLVSFTMATGHHFRGIGHYAEQLMDLAEGKPVFRGQKPSNKKVLAAIAAIQKCQQGSFFKPCSCGWHTKAAARKQARAGASTSTRTTSSSTASADQSKVGSGPVPPKFDKSDFQSPTISDLRVCEHYIAHGLCNDFPDWSIAAVGSEDSVQIGYEYAQSVTGEEHQVEPDLPAEQLIEQLTEPSDRDHVVPDPLEEGTMVVTSVEVLKELGLDAVDLVDEAPSMFESTSHHVRPNPPPTDDVPNTQAIQLDPSSTLSGTPGDSQLDPFLTSPGTPGDIHLDPPSTLLGSPGDIHLDPPSTLLGIPGDSQLDLPSTLLGTPGDFHLVPFLTPLGTPGDFHLVPFLTPLGTPGDIHLDPPSTLLGTPGDIHLDPPFTLLGTPGDSQLDPPSTLLGTPEDFHLVPFFTLLGTPGDSHLDPSLTPPLLQQPPRVASPVIPAPTMSHGPDQVTSQEKAAEREEKLSKKRKQKEVASPSGSKPPSKKKSVAHPEFVKRQKRAADRMVELGVSPQKPVPGRRRCPVCSQLRTAKDKTSDGLNHRVLGPSNRIWCPYADNRSILEDYEKEKKERQKVSWRKSNEKKRLKKIL